MRRLPIVLLLLLATPLSAAPPWNESDPRVREPRAAGRHVIVTATAGVFTEGDRDELAAKGIRIQQALTGGRYIARIPAGGEALDARVASVDDFTDRQKIHRSAMRRFASGASIADVYIHFHRDVTLDEAREAILASGGALEDPLATRFGPMQRVRARVTSESVRALAADDRIFAVAGVLDLRITTDNANSAAAAHVTEVQAAPYGLTGQGITVSVFELGEAQTSHPEFGGRVTTHPPGFCGGTGSSCTSNKRHATHVIGTIAAAGNTAGAKGMAPMAMVHEFPVSDDWLDLKRDELAPLGVAVDNNSWGYVLGWDGGGTTWWGYAEYNGAYDLESSAPIDEISAEKNILFVHSSGNSAGKPNIVESNWFEHTHMDEKQNDELPGKFCYSKNGTGLDCPTTCLGTVIQTGESRCETTAHPEGPWETVGVTSAAKNVLTVGNIGSNLSISRTSSRGPAKDGRVKPDVVAVGTNVFSTVPTSTYATMSGTSMSTPAVTGLAALLAEQWRLTFDGTDATPAQLRALIIAGATDLGLAGPDYTYGFGLVNAKASADLIRADDGAGTRIRNLTLSHGQVNEFRLVVTESGPVRVLLNWPDPAIPRLGDDDIAAKALVNDLDLKLIDPAGNTVLPYVLDRAGTETPAARGVNTTDNAEMVEIVAATPGVYRLLVNGTTIAQGPQDAVLVSSARIARGCIDSHESNDTAQTAFGNLPSGALVTAGFCSQGDLDFYRFKTSKKGTVAIVLETGDNPIRATLTGTGVNTSTEVAANSTKTLSVNVTSTSVALTLKIEATGSLGADPHYSFTATYGEAPQRKQRGVRR